MKTMIKSTKGILVFLIGLTLFSFASHTNLLERLLAQLDKYRLENPIEKVYLHLDRPYYLADENIYFKPYIINNSVDPNEIESLLYIELISPENIVITQGKIKYSSKNNKGSSLHIPDSIRSGEYQLVAYTNWMKNYDESFFYKKRINIYSNNGSIVNEVSPAHKLALTFYPEGGMLVDGLTTKVGVKAIDASGQGVDVSGQIVDQTNTVVSTFKTLHSGIGSFILQPKANNKYAAIIENQGDTISVELPQVYVEGIAMQVNNYGKENIKVMIQTNRPNYAGAYLLVAQTNNQIQYSAQSQAGSKGFIAAIPKSKLPEGIMHIALFEDSGKMLGERLVYVNNPSSTEVIIKSAQDKYSTRDKVVISVETPIGSKVSASVTTRKKDPTSQTINTSLQLSTDLNDVVESPGFYFDKSNPYAAVALDNLLLTSELGRFSWEKILGNALMTQVYDLERDLLIKGIAYDNSMNKLTNAELSISIPQELASYEAKTDSTGRFQSFVFDYFGAKQVVVQQLNREGQIVFVLDEGFIQRSVNADEYFNDKTQLEENILLQLEDQKIMAAFEIEDQKQIQHINPAIQQLTSNNYKNMYDQEILLSEYISFPTMREVFREIVHGIIVPFSGNRFKVYSKDLKRNFDGLPLFMIDGIPTFNVEFILELNPGEVHSVGLITSQGSLSKFGHLGKNGIVAINSKNGKTITNIPQDKTFESYRGYSMYSEYISPTYESIDSKNSRIPDLRSLIYWNPNISTGSDGISVLEFYTSDKKGTYEIVIEGLTANGQPLYATSSFQVD